jgi:hypothetical protein
MEVERFENFKALKISFQLLFILSIGALVEPLNGFSVHVWTSNAAENAA